MTSSRRSTALVVGVLVMVSSTLLGVRAASAASERSLPTHWVGAWAASPEAGGGSAADQSYRLYIHTSIGGPELRLRFSNSYGAVPVTLRDVTVARPQSPLVPSVEPDTVRHVRFRSGAALTIPAGRSRRSLPLRYPVPGDAWLAVSFFAPGSYRSTTYHGTAWGLNWQTLPDAGDHAADASGLAFAVPLTSWTYLSGVDVMAPSTVSTVVALGDSITDCCYSVPDSNDRWPDLLNRRLAAAPGGQRFSVVNAGINGNELTADRGGNDKQGAAGVARIYRDVFAEPNVSTLILFEGINDIGNGVAAGPIEAAYLRVLRAAHQRGIRVLISTMTPSVGAGISSVTNLHPDLASFAATRDALNRWIEAHRSRFDGVIHFGEVVQDPSVPAIWNPVYSMGDQTHPNLLGLQAMADSIPLSLFR